MLAPVHVPESDGTTTGPVLEIVLLTNVILTSAAATGASMAAARATSEFVIFMA
jgi:hypothetical protein